MDKYLGTVKWFDKKRGYGFVLDDEYGDDYFLHITNMNKKGEKLQWPSQGDKVKFNINHDEKGDQAVNVDIVERAKRSGKKKDK